MAVFFTGVAPHLSPDMRSAASSRQVGSQLAKELGGRGGGKGTRFQGKLPDLRPCFEVARRLAEATMTSAATSS